MNIMSNVLIIGATGKIGGAVRQTLLKETEDELTLFSKDAAQLTTEPSETAFAGDINNEPELDRAMKDKDVVVVAVSDRVDEAAQNVIKAMDKNKVSRLIFITTMGIYNEIPKSIGVENLKDNPDLQSYRDAADLVEQSDLDYTIVRPGKLTNGSVNYEITKKGEPFGARDVSMNSIADFVKTAIHNDRYYAQESVGLSTI